MSVEFTLRFRKALVFAARLHGGQTRKGTDIAYIAHLMAVASLVITHGGNEDEAIAALLHDAVEDQGGRPTLQTIRKRFGNEVASIVEGCTDTDIMPKPPWRERKARYLKHLASATRSVRLVAAADKLDNIRAIIADYRTHGPALWSRFNAGVDEQRWFYRSCVTALQRDPMAIVRDLDLAVREFEELTSPLPPDR
ncbi:MAG: HD domain-containing protein [Nitrospira sp. BO4]|jgi:(p)ppGpp synthase/HD superfamily hydrolase|nr:HD domain-containing protein [Nitrospira sp. BO4]